jgi:hypothetical protein
MKFKDTDAAKQFQEQYGSKGFVFMAELIRIPMLYAIYLQE